VGPWIQVNVLALTDHDTMDGVPVALQVALELGIRLIPGVEISAKFASRFLFLRPTLAPDL
jgi:predicted metal-dependent phosphoesterase TrpH